RVTVCEKCLTQSELLLLCITDPDYGAIIIHTEQQAAAIGVRHGNHFLGDALGARNTALEFELTTLAERDQLREFLKVHLGRTDERCTGQTQGVYRLLYSVAGD